MEKTNKSNSFFSWILTIVVAVLLGLFIQNFILGTTYVKGISMEPTLKEKDRLLSLVYPLYYSIPESGNIVIIDAPAENKKYIKRVIGTPGDEIEIKNGKVYKNNKLYNEIYLSSDVYTNTFGINKWKLSENEFFVMGDNRPNSMDSRVFGPITKKHIRGITTFRFWPMNRIKEIGKPINN